MPNLTQLRLAAREIFDEALRAIDPGAAVRNAVRFEAPRVTIFDRVFDLPSEADVFVVAMGKAATSMAVALEDIFDERLTAGVIAAPTRFVGGRELGKCWQYFEGGHPLPNEASLAAAKAAFALLERANREPALLLFLISGGGSAMMEWSINEDISLDDLRAANQTLVKSGASIAEINAVRKMFSAVKGGRLAARAWDSRQVTLVVSDVPKGQERDVASGPTLPPQRNAPDVAEVLARYDLRERLPSSILKAIESRPSIPELPAQPDYFVLLDNVGALRAAQAAALRRGLAAEIAYDISDEIIEAGCASLISSLANLSSSANRTAAPVCLISGGEFSCPVCGDGIGGRNLETALRLAISVAEHSESFGEFVALCAGTDGIDGNSPAAGAIVDSTTIERAHGIGLDPQDFLNRSDSYSFFVALGDAITTGATGTNVRDLRILIASGD